jgi:uncharacterized protein (DUF697 family)/tellurite resistance protein
MSESEQKALLTIVLMAAAADGRDDVTERAEIMRIAASLSKDSAQNVTAIHQDVSQKRVTLADAVVGLTTPDARRMAYELAVGVCNADGAENEAERAFLSSLKTALGFDAAAAASATTFSANANALALAPLATVSSAEPATRTTQMSGDELNRVILHYAILNGALELLPDSLATLAIVPLQMKMVYRIGRSYGVELDRGHIKEFVATAGVGLASQFVEQIGVKLVGSLFGGGLIGGLLGGLAGQSVSSGFSFATTYALGQLAVKYYAGGRTLSTQMLQDTYQQLLGEAKTLQGQHLTEIQERARNINLSQLLQDIQQ